MLVSNTEKGGTRKGREKNNRKANKRQDKFTKME